MKFLDRIRNKTPKDDAAPQDAQAEQSADLIGDLIAAASETPLAPTPAVYGKVADADSRPSSAPTTPRSHTETQLADLRLPAWAAAASPQPSASPNLSQGVTAELLYHGPETPGRVSGTLRTLCIQGQDLSGQPYVLVGVEHREPLPEGGDLYQLTLEERPSAPDRSRPPSPAEALTGSEQGRVTLNVECREGEEARLSSARGNSALLRRLNLS